MDRLRHQPRPRRRGAVLLLLATVRRRLPWPRATHGDAHGRAMREPFAFRWAMILPLVALLGLTPARAAQEAAAPCPGMITRDTTLTQDIVAQPGGPTDCISFGASGITLDLNGRTIDIRPLGLNGRAVVTGWFGMVSNVTVAGGGATIKTTYDDPFAGQTPLWLSHSVNVAVRDVTLLNLDAAGRPVPPSLRGGADGIRLYYVTGATVTSNEVAFYGRGIWLWDSGATVNFNTIGSNRVHDNGSDNGSSLGIVLERSSGWKLTNNDVRRNGSRVHQDGGAIYIGSNSHGNAMAGNRVEQNFGPGITVHYSRGNSIERNEARQNGVPGRGPDLRDTSAAPSPNTWSPDNRCEFVAGSVPATACALAE